MIDDFVPDTMIREILDHIATSRKQFEQARTHMETKITNYTTGRYCQPHQDATEWSAGQHRILSWLLYFYRQSKKFTGGDLYMLDTYLSDETTAKFYIRDEYTKIEPANMFRSVDYHAVTRTTLPGDKFMGGRMAVSSHISNI